MVVGASHGHLNLVPVDGAAQALSDTTRTTTALKLPEDLPIERWQAVGVALHQMGQAVQWWIGDWLRYGKAAYGKKYKVAAEVTGFSQGTLRDMKSVADRIDLSRRRDNLPWSYHREVVGLDPAVADDLLDQAELKGWSRARIRAAVRVANEVVRCVAPDPDTSEVGPRGDRSPRGEPDAQVPGEDLVQDEFGDADAPELEGDDELELDRPAPANVGDGVRERVGWSEALAEESVDVLIVALPGPNDADDFEEVVAEQVPDLICKVKPTGRAYFVIDPDPDVVVVYRKVRRWTQMLAWFCWAQDSSANGPHAADLLIVLLYQGPDAAPLAAEAAGRPSAVFEGDSQDLVRAVRATAPDGVVEVGPRLVKQGSVS